MNKILIRSRFSPRRRVSIDFSGTKSRTKQAFAKEADINNIMRQYIKTGLMPEGTAKPSYGDFSDGSDFRSVCDRILIAEAEFGRLDADIRKKFNNNPADLLDFLANPANEAEGIELGLIPGTNGVVTKDTEAEEAEAPAAPAAEAAGAPAAEA